MLIGKAIECAIEGKALTFFGNPEESLRSFTYVEDLCQGIESLLNYENLESWSAWNLGNPTNISCRAVLDILESELQVTGKSIKIVYGAKDSQDTKETLANIQKAREHLGWEPTTDIQVGIRKTIRSLC
jgi:nucleoside-diphosphate-sugar epimerase